MIVDSSAIVAVLLDEPERGAFLEAIRSAPQAAMSAVSCTEVGVVLDGRRNGVLSRQYDVLLEELGVTVLDVTAGQARVAREAYRDFGRGSGHPARLNFGDCFSYALAAERDEPLLFKGDDFGHTDVRRAV
ncbi:type II toxin-antitoxin system VapC family toxin [Ornithinimicrobium sp. F0845]|uniref:type II toxin-antitoxin system VapC family toxin n=1 Tax=Ornithinimicrobium sp. F0845 TaxID=2926412 RepID=UPI001FF698D5|nr:type II toxin-antitoxin system VapC family toxin [Ornithinimicrobium sp. F0845]MCK0111545.1 type II toxin-antitoxin system VapC family toxin [Ornithinimicrobium sp. F0845]